LRRAYQGAALDFARHLIPDGYFPGGHGSCFQMPKAAEFHQAAENGQSLVAEQYLGIGAV
jgi:hypothetical protein